MIVAKTTARKLPRDCAECDFRCIRGQCDAVCFISKEKLGFENLARLTDGSGRRVIKYGKRLKLCPLMEVLSVQVDEK